MHDNKLYFSFINLKVNMFNLYVKCTCLFQGFPVVILDILL